MQKPLFALLILLLGIGAADASHRHGHRQRGDVIELRLRGQFAPADPLMDSDRNPPSVRGGDMADMIPPQWQVLPPEPNWKGRRFRSPDGSAWIALYDSQAGEEAIAAHMKAIAFADGEQITFLRGERDWIVVSGVKDDRIFYRKAALACHGHAWHHIALEYPVSEKRRMDGLVTRLSRDLDRHENAGCEPAVSSQ